MARTPYAVTYVSAQPATLTDATHPSGEAITSADVTDGIYDFSLYDAVTAQITVFSVSGSSPVLDVTMQSSNDKLNWVTVIAFAQFGAAGTKQVHVPTDASIGSAPKTFGKWVRFIATVGGTGTPTLISTLTFHPKG